MKKYRYFYKLPNAKTVIVKCAIDGSTSYVIRPDHPTKWRPTKINWWDMECHAQKFPEYIQEIKAKDVKNIVEIWKHPGWEVLWGYAPVKNTTPWYIISMGDE